MQDIKVVSALALTEDQEHRLKRMVYGNGHFDHEGGYLDGAGLRHQLAALHFCLSPIPDVSGGESRIVSIDTHHFGKESPYLYLEDRLGKMTGWGEARSAIPSKWHYGVILQDAEGDVWFCGVDEIGHDEITGNEPLRRLSRITPDVVRMENGEILDNLPADGEFWLSEEPEPKVTSIPWWGHLNAEDAHLREEARAPMRALLDRIQTRIRAENAAELQEPIV